MNRRTFLTTGLAAGAAMTTGSVNAAESGVEKNKALARRFSEELWGEGDPAVADEILSPDFVNHDPFAGMTPDREGEKQFRKLHRAALPGLSTVEDEIAEGDKVVTRWTYRGVHKGAFMGIPATGKEVKVKGINICRIQDGKIVELWREVDVVGLLQQLGAMPRRQEKK